MLTFVPDGTRLLGFNRIVQRGSLQDAIQTSVLLAFDRQGLALHLTENSPPPIDMAGYASLDPSTSLRFVELAGNGAYDNLTVTVDGRQVISDEFASGDLTEWEVYENGNDVGRPVTGDDAVVEAGENIVFSDFSAISRDLGENISGDFVVEADMRPMETETATAQMWVSTAPFFGPFEGTQGRFLVASGLASVQQRGFVQAEGDSDNVFELTDFFPVVPGLTYRVRLVVENGVISTTTTSPIVWFTVLDTEEPLTISGLASLENSLAIAVGAQVHLTTSESFAESVQKLEVPASELRVWENRSGPQFGICQPERHQVRIGPTEATASRLLSWPFSDPDIVLGSALGQDDGDLVFPLSFDASPDGRIYVLDAGNSRIQSFGASGTYISQWGSRGNDDDQFDFGRGLEPTDFAGSLIVDDEGFIYVSDVGNKRIQKFAP